MMSDMEHCVEDHGEHCDSKTISVETPNDQVTNLAQRVAAMKSHVKKKQVRVGSPFDSLKTRTLETFNESKTFCAEIAELYDMIKIPLEDEVANMDTELKKDFASLETKKKILNGLGASVAELTQDLNAFQQYVFKKFVRPSRAQVAKLQYQHDELVLRLHNLRKFCAGVTSAAWTPPRPETNPNKDSTHVPHGEYHSEQPISEDFEEVTEEITETADETPEKIDMDDKNDEDDEDNFEKCETFAGARPGWEFKVGSKGVGYYKSK